MSRLTANTLNVLIACSHRRHGQDKTVLSCPCRRCEQVAPITSTCHGFYACITVIGSDWGFWPAHPTVLRQFSSIQLQMYIAPWVENKSEAPSKKCLLRLWRQREYNCLSINKPLHGRQALWGHVGATAPNSFLAIHVSARFWHVMWAPPMCLPLCVCVSSSRHIM